MVAHVAHVLRILPRSVVLATTLITAACGGSDPSPTQTAAAPLAQVAMVTQAPSAVSVPREKARMNILSTTEASNASLWTECEDPSKETFTQWVEATFPQYFSGNKSFWASVDFGGKTYEPAYWWYNKDNYLGISTEGDVDVYGNLTNFVLVNEGKLIDYACQVKRWAWGNRNVLYVHVKPSDAQSDPFPVTDSVGRLETIRQFYREDSYGKVELFYTMGPWTKLPNPMSYYEGDLTGQKLLQEATALVGQNYNVGKFDIVAIVLPRLSNGFPDCLGGKNTYVAQDGRRKVVGQIYVGGCTHDAGKIAHEIGHALGAPLVDWFGHSSSVMCLQPNWLPASWIDPTWSAEDCGIWEGKRDAHYSLYSWYDVMGGFRGHHSVPRKQKAGWVNPSQIKHLPEGGSVTLSPLETPASDIMGVKVLLGHGPSGDEIVYWVEYRKQAGLSLEDNSVAPLVGASDIVKIWYAFSGMSYEPITNRFRNEVWSSELFTIEQQLGQGPKSNTALEIGDRFHDKRRGVEVSRGQDVQGKATVTVRVSSLKTDPAVYTVITRGQTQVVTVTNTGTVAVRNTAAKIDGRHPESFSIIADSCSGKTLSPAQKCSISVKVDFPSGSTESRLAHLEWTSTDPLRPKPTVAFQGVPN